MCTALTVVHLQLHHKLHSAECGADSPGSLSWKPLLLLPTNPLMEGLEPCGMRRMPFCVRRPFVLEQETIWIWAERTHMLGLRSGCWRGAFHLPRQRDLILQEPGGKWRVGDDRVGWNITGYCVVLSLWNKCISGTSSWRKEIKFFLPCHVSYTAVTHYMNSLQGLGLVKTRVVKWGGDIQKGRRQTQLLTIVSLYLSRTLCCISFLCSVSVSLSHPHTHTRARARTHTHTHMCMHTATFTHHNSAGVAPDLKGSERVWFVLTSCRNSPSSARSSKTIN